MVHTQSATVLGHQLNDDQCREHSHSHGSRTELDYIGGLVAKTTSTHRLLFYDCIVPHLH